MMTQAATHLAVDTGYTREVCRQILLACDADGYAASRAALYCQELNLEPASVPNLGDIAELVTRVERATGGAVDAVGAVASIARLAELLDPNEKPPPD